MEEIIITIRPDGTVKFETHGITGETCVDISKLFEKALTGSKDDEGENDNVQRDLKSEYYQDQGRNDINVQDRSS